MSKDESNNAVLYIRLDAELAEALRLHCFRVGMKKNPFVIGMLQRELGLDEGEGPEPDPDPGVAKGVPEVAPSPSGKALTGAEQSSPTCLHPINPPERLLPAVEEGFSLSAVESAETGSRKATRKKCHRMPEDFGKTPGLLSYAEGKGVIDPDNQFEQFQDYHAARGTVFLDWLAAWRTWVRNALRYQEQQNVRAIQTANRNAARISEKQRVAEQIFNSTPRGYIVDNQDQHSVISGANIVSRRLTG